MRHTQLRSRVLRQHSSSLDTSCGSIAAASQEQQQRQHQQRSSAAASTRCMEHLVPESLQQHGMLAAGALFGAGWWAMADTLLHSALVMHTHVGAV